MRCDEARLAVSLDADHELPEVAEAPDVPEPPVPADPAEPSDGPTTDALVSHVRGCPDCAGFQQTVQQVRRTLRFEPVGVVPDIAADVMARLPARRPRPTGHRPLPRHRTPRRRPVLVAAAAAAAGFVAGATFVGIGVEPQSPAAADLPARVLAAQHGIASVDARIEIVEHGRPGRARPRRLTGELVYAAPESLALTLREAAPGDPDEHPTAGGGRPVLAGGAEPAGAGDVRLTVDETRWWLEATRLCSSVAIDASACPTGTRPWTRLVEGREPFSQDAPVPLELVSPVDSFTLANAPATLGRRSIAGREAIGVTVTAGQVAPLLDGLSPAGDLRAVHPADPAEVWLDADHLVPLAVVVRTGPGDDRARWASSHAYADVPGQVVVSFSVTAIDVNGGVPRSAFEVPPARAARRDPDDVADGGFRPAAPAAPAVTGAPVLTDVPDGFHPYRSGTVSTPGGPTVAVRSWTDGRAWFTVRSTRDWRGDRLFGNVGPEVRIVDLGGDGHATAGQAYASADGRHVAVHGDGVDLVVSGSIGADALREVAAALAVTGHPVPDGWDEARASTLADARAAIPGLLEPRGLTGFGAPAVRIDGGTVSQSYAGPGERSFVLTQSDAPRLPPPSGADAAGVTVRGVAGRYSHERGELAWIERGASHSLSSPTLTLAELVEVADRLEPS